MSWIVRNAKLSECDRSLLTYRVSESLVFSQIKRLQSALNQRNQYEESNSSDSSSRFLSTPTEWYNYLENVLNLQLGSLFPLTVFRALVWEIKKESRE